MILYFVHFQSFFYNISSNCNGCGVYGECCVGAAFFDLHTGASITILVSIVARLHVILAEESKRKRSKLKQEEPEGETKTGQREIQWRTTVLQTFRLLWEFAVILVSFFETLITESAALTSLWGAWSLKFEMSSHGQRAISPISCLWGEKVEGTGGLHFWSKEGAAESKVQ